MFSYGDGDNREDDEENEDDDEDQDYAREMVIEDILVDVEQLFEQVPYPLGTKIVARF